MKDKKYETIHNLAKEASDGWKECLNKWKLTLWALTASLVLNTITLILYYLK